MKLLDKKNEYKKPRLKTIDSVDKVTKAVTGGNSDEPIGDGKWG